MFGSEERRSAARTKGMVVKKRLITKWAARVADIENKASSASLLPEKIGVSMSGVDAMNAANRTNISMANTGVKREMVVRAKMVKAVYFAPL